MSDGTKIEWTDATWNPITGCSVVSAGCKHCYAMKLAGTRMRNEPSRAGLTVDTAAGPVWNGQVRFNRQWLEQPLHWSRPRRIFVCAHGDLFHENVPDEWIRKVFDIMSFAPRHTFQVLTKRAKRMEQLVPMLAPRYTARNGTGWPLANVWLGVSVEDQGAANERIPYLLRTPAAVRFLSCEPLLNHVDLTAIDDGCAHREVPREDWGDMDDDDSPPGLWWNALTGERTIMHGGADGLWSRTDTSIDWVIAGGESGPRARPMHPDWARSLRDQCADAGVPFLFKQWGEFVSVSEVEGPGRHHQFADGATVRRIGKKLAGRTLDGVEHNAMPEAR